MDSVAVQNLVSYSVQVLLLVSLASGLTAALRVDAASVRYGFWRTIFAFCLLLPLLQPRQMPPVAAPQTTSGVVEATVVPAGTPMGTAAAHSIDWESWIIPALGAGAAGRLFWLAASLVRLRRLRRRGESTSPSEPYSDLARLIDVDCEVRHVAGLRQPVTFGLLRPVILLPTELATCREDIQRAVLSHELFHVKRRDWGWLVFEEIVCAVLWFNPAIWWLVSRLQLAREAVVDELAVLATGRRRAYVQALMTFAERTSPASGAAFGSRAQLFHRIVLLSKEAGMSSRRLVFTCAVTITVFGAGALYAVRAFPLIAPMQTIRQDAPGPLEEQARPVTPENPVPRRTNYEPAVYPAEARAAGASGRVTLMLTLDELGRVAEVRRLGISVSSRNPAVDVRIRNSTPLDQANFLVNRSREQSDAMRAIAIAIDDSAFRAVQQWRYEPPFAAPLSFPVTISVSEGQAETSGAVSPAGGSLGAEGAVRIGGNIKTPTKIHDVRPVYPPVAQSARISGVVVLEILVGRDGTVQEAQILRAVPLLDQAAVDAVMQWRFRPTLLNGQAVPAIMTVTVSFTLDSAEGRRGQAGLESDPQRETAADTRRNTELRFVLYAASLLFHGAAVKVATTGA